HPMASAFPAMSCKSLVYLRTPLAKRMLPSSQRCEERAPASVGAPDTKLAQRVRRKVMVRGNQRFSGLRVVLLAGMVVLSGCATKKYVREQVQTVQPGIQDAQNATKE